MKNKVLRLNSAFTVDQKALATSGDSEIISIFIEGYASTVDIDRSGDVVPKSVWEAGIQNYLKNPIILCQHDYDDPIGRMVDYRVDDKGLWVKARISSAAEEVFGLIKDKILTAFSIGFRVLDAEYNSAAEVFVIKELELVEISVVSVPCNQNTVFDLSKAFENAQDYKEFKQQFAPNGNSAKGLESTTEAKSTTTKELEMNQEEMQKMLADAAAMAAEQATTKLLAAQAAEKAAVDAQAKAEAELEAKVKSAVAAQISVGQSGAEKLLAEVSKRMEDQAAESKNVLAGLEAALKEKAEEITKLQASKMTFTEGNSSTGPSYQEKEYAFLLSNITHKAIQDSKYAQKLVEKYGQHLPNATWEQEVSLNMENEIRRKLVVAPQFRQINMQTNVMKIPVNPEAGVATWVNNSDFGDSSSDFKSAGAARTHALSDITLSSFKVATREYMNFEEEEDSLILILPFVKDAMIRRIARSMDRALLVGAKVDGDPIQGLAKYSTSVLGTTTTTITAKVTVEKLRALRAALGTLGLDPAEVTYFVNNDVYYNLLDDEKFQTMNQVGPQATLLTGQIGQIGNSPVLVSGELPVMPSSNPTAVSLNTLTNVGALAVYTPNFVIGNQRGLRLDTQDLVEQQRRVMVSSMRMGFQQLTTNLGQGVAALRYTAAS
jgi:HK97 family phage prohead protease